MMRRIYTPTLYEFLEDLHPINLLITVSTFGLGFAQIPLVVNFFWGLH